jgi:aspartyl-tRNA(Asn)/glutamyl-tRNA(Gln) amidotransferase subunit A
MRILRGEGISAADYIDLLDARKSLIARATVASRPMTRWCCRPPPTRRRASPTCRRQGFHQGQPASLRNCTLINMIDGCAISLPCHREGEVPVGLMVAASGGSDRRVFELAAAMEDVIRV